jgi:hypothetical protein
VNFREWYAIGCHLPSCIWLAHPPKARSEASVSKRRGCPAWKMRKHGGVMLAFFSCWKASSASLLQTKGVSFRVSCVSGLAILEKSLMNCRLKFRNPRKDYTPLTFSILGQSRTTLIFSSLILIPFAPTMYPRKATSFRWNLHFCGLGRR